MVTVGVVSPGAMGGALGRGWVEAGARVVATVEGRSARTRNLAHGIELLPSLADVVGASDVVVSVVPPGEAYAVASAIAAAARETGAMPLVADLNAVAPATVGRVAGALAPLDLVDGSISGGPPDDGVTRVYLSGPRAEEVAALGHPRLDVRVLPGPAGTASAVKMSTASVYKGFSAVLLHAAAAAEANSVLDVVLDDLAREYASMVAGLAPRLAVAGAKAHRFVGEMREIATTQESAGLPRELFEAMALVWENAAASPLGDVTPEEARAEDDLARVVRRLLSRGAP